MLEAGIVPAAIGVADQPRRVGNQDQALRIRQNLGGKIVFAVQLRLVSAQTRDIEHQSTHLQQFSLVVVEAEGVDENMNRRAILAP